MDGVGPIAAGHAFAPAAAAGAGRPAEARAFQEILQESIDRVARLQAEADGTLARLRLGQATEAEAVIAFDRARQAVETMTEIRNRIVAAFNEIQQMRV